MYTTLGDRSETVPLLSKTGREEVRDGWQSVGQHTFIFDWQGDKCSYIFLVTDNNKTEGAQLSFFSRQIASGWGGHIPGCCVWSIHIRLNYYISPGYFEQF